MQRGNWFQLVCGALIVVIGTVLAVWGEEPPIRLLALLLALSGLVQVGLAFRRGLEK